MLLEKLPSALGIIFYKTQSKLTLEIFLAFRDWGFAGDYTRGMYMMMNHHSPDDWVLATGETHTVKEFAKLHTCLI